MSLKGIEEVLIEKLNGKEFWGEIDFSKEEYEELKVRIKDFLERVDIIYIEKSYPVSLTTFMVFLMRYKYNDNFWGLLKDELEITLRQFDEGRLGLCARNTFKKYGFNYDVVENETRVNLEPILYEACLPPISSLDTLFYLLSYDSMRTFDPQLMIEELIDSRSYSIRKPLLHFLQRFQDNRAIDFLLEVHDAMLSVDQMMDCDSQYIDSYSEWKERESSKEVITRRKKQENRARPYLSFENGGKGLVMVLPYTIMKDEWVEDALWTVKGKGGFKKSIRCKVLGSEGKRYMESVSISVTPDEEYFVYLEDEEDLDSEKDNGIKVVGIERNSIIYFNASGRQIRSNYIQAPYGIMIIPKKIDFATKHCTVDYQSYPTDNENYEVVSIAPLGQDAEIKIGSADSLTIYTLRPQINIDLEGKRLFCIQPEYTNMFVELPVVRIHFDGFCNIGFLEIHIGSHIIPVDKLENGDFIIETKRMKQQFKKYGTYNIRVYQGKKFLKQAEFSYVPKIKSDCPSIVYWPCNEFWDEVNNYKFDRIEDWELEFTNCVVKNDESKYVVECPANVGSIQGTLRSHTDNFLFEKNFEIPVKPLEVHILNKEGEEERISTDKYVHMGLTEYNEDEYWLAIRTFGCYQKSTFQVKLVTANGVEQCLDMKLTQNGYGNLNLSIFFDTLNRCPLPAKMEIWCDKDENKKVTVLVITEKLLLEKRPRFTKKRDYLVLDLKDDRKDVILRKFGLDRLELFLPYLESKLSKSGDVRGYKFPAPLDAGIYSVTVTKKNDCFIYDSDDEVVLSLGTDTLYVSHMEQRDTEITTVSHWLDELIRDILKCGTRISMEQKRSLRMLDKIGKLEKNKLSSYDIEIIVSLAYFYNCKIADEKRVEILKIMKEINRDILSSYDRYKILQFLVDIHCSKEIFDICVENYMLSLFSNENNETKGLAAKVDRYDPELAMMLLMSTCASMRDTIWREKYRDLIGREAIVSLLDVQGMSEKEGREEQKKFLREQRGSKVKIKLSDEIAGDLKPIQTMIEPQKGYKVRFNKAKKPDFGIYFNHIKYVDQYVNWFCLNHNEECDLDPGVKTRMIKLVVENMNDILESIKELKKNAEYSNIVKEFDAALSKRRGDGLEQPLTINSHPRFFYLQGISALLAKLPGQGKMIEYHRERGRRYLAEAMEIAPRLCKRDVLMAETFIYLKRKEEKLCR